MCIDTGRHERALNDGELPVVRPSVDYVLHPVLVMTAPMLEVILETTLRERTTEKDGVDLASKMMSGVVVPLYETKDVGTHMATSKAMDKNGTAVILSVKETLAMLSAAHALFVGSYIRFPESEVKVVINSTDVAETPVDSVEGGITHTKVGDHAFARITISDVTDGSMSDHTVTAEILTKTTGDGRDAAASCRTVLIPIVSGIVSGTVPILIGVETSGALTIGVNGGYVSVATVGRVSNTVAINNTTNKGTPCCVLSSAKGGAADNVSAVHNIAMPNNITGGTHTIGGEAKKSAARENIVGGNGGVSILGTPPEGGAACDM